VSEQDLAELVQRLLAEGRLPRVRSAILLAGYGRGELCSVCTVPMAATDVVYELRFAPGDERSPVIVHYGCFIAWERARLQMRAAPQAAE